MLLKSGMSEVNFSNERINKVMFWEYHSVVIYSKNHRKLHIIETDSE